MKQEINVFEKFQEVVEILMLLDESSQETKNMNKIVQELQSQEHSLLWSVLGKSF